MSERKQNQPQPVSPAFAVPNLLMNHLVEVARLGAEQETRAKKAESQSRIDYLTGLPNRRAMEEEFNRLAALSDRTRSPLSVVAIDLDHFKRINDTKGHARGDEALKEVAGMIKEQERAGDMAARWGGEEFMLLLPNTDEAGALVMAERLRGYLEDHGPVTASLGVAEYSGENGQVFKHADEALYEAKTRGRNAAVAYSGRPPK